jgi:hypothetical protein
MLCSSTSLFTGEPRAVLDTCKVVIDWTVRRRGTVERLLKKKSPAGSAPHDNFEIPVWVDIPPSFYTQLNDLARELKRPRRELLMEGLSLVKKQARQKPLGVERIVKDAVMQQSVREFASKRAKKMWEQATPEERAERARLMAEARWGKKKPDASGKATKGVSPKRKGA